MNPEPRLPLGHDAYNFARMLVPNVVLAWPSEHSLDGQRNDGLVMLSDGTCDVQPAGNTARPPSVHHRWSAAARVGTGKLVSTLRRGYEAPSFGV